MHYRKLIDYKVDLILIREILLRNLESVFHLEHSSFQDGNEMHISFFTYCASTVVVQMWVCVCEKWTTAGNLAWNSSRLFRRLISAIRWGLLDVKEISLGHTRAVISTDSDALNLVALQIPHSLQTFEGGRGANEDKNMESKLSFHYSNCFSSVLLGENFGCIVRIYFMAIKQAKQKLPCWEKSHKTNIPGDN